MNINLRCLMKALLLEQSIIKVCLTSQNSDVIVIE